VTAQCTSSHKFSYLRKIGAELYTQCVTEIFNLKIKMDEKRQTTRCGMNVTFNCFTLFIACIVMQ